MILGNENSLVNFATKQLKKLEKAILKYYFKHHNTNKSFKRISIYWTKEELLNFRNEDFRYLIEGKFKIIYCVDKETIRIYSVFHTKQNPEKSKI